ncbi:elicitor-responsive protein 3 [Selaginella moellendorffii]|uniref:elicitor-responsive protein 3 n=1 Tax=Selaginella moellendorffii TaxID=88036 RepID=UPI000D1CBC76|nr:elicitor-responsive protein 3 [Selaginella moellendorffii]|eukprot:XP_024545254.1 elicitor-responsive protein 3 [Selaginella moellendorffii]
MVKGALEVHLRGATGIKNTDFLSIGQGSNPIWNQKFLFVVEDGVSELFIKLVPLNRVLSELDHPLASYNVIRPSGKVKGEVMVALKFTPKVRRHYRGSHSFLT